MDFKYYFQPYKQYFWQWEDNYEVIAIPNGSTIGYFEAIASIIKSFEKQPIPPFGSLLLTIVALNDSMSDDIGEIELLIEKTLKDNQLDFKDNLDLLKQGVTFLRVIQSLPDAYKSKKNKPLLIQTIFTETHNAIGLKYADDIKEKLEENTFGRVLNSPVSFDKRVFVRDFRTLGLLNKRFPTAQKIIDSLSGLPNLISSLQLNLDKQEGIGNGIKEKDFVEQLIDNPKTFQIGALIKRIWSGLSIPYHLSNPGGQPLGGVSDLTNKGDFDRLLISEFANDDLVFLSRLANNEALYLRREAPPSQEKFERIILIDVSIKNWGTPKLLAYAVAVAITNHPKTDIDCIGFAVGNQVQRVYFDNEQKIIESLNYLDHCLHPATGLEEFLKDHGRAKNAEIFFISSEEVIRFPEMQRILNEYHALFKYWVNVNASGGIKLYKNQYKTKRLIQEIHLPLDDLWKKTKPVKNVEDISTDDTIHKFPLLVPKSNLMIRFLPLSKTLKFVITRNKMLCQQMGPHKGLWQIQYLKFIDKSCKFEIGAFENGEVVILCYLPGVNKIRFYNLNTQTFKTLSVKISRGHTYPEFFFFDQAFHYYNGYKLWRITYHPEIKIEITRNFPIVLKEAYEKRQKEMYTLGETSLYSVLRNLKEVYINNAGCLVFNIHELLEDNEGTLKLNRTQFTNKVIEARANTKSKVFSFRDGSEVTLDKSGIIILKSSHHDIDDIYIPSAINIQLAASNAKEYSGNQYFIPADQPGLVNMRDFYKKHIEGFINQITNYEGKN